MECCYLFVFNLLLLCDDILVVLYITSLCSYGIYIKNISTYQHYYYNTCILNFNKLR